MKRSTIKVSFVIEKANAFIRNSADSDKDRRLGIASLLEAILFETNNYRGYSYLTETDMKNSLNGKIPGISENQFGNDRMMDESRRKYS